MLATVRVVLSVAVSTRNAMPWGPYPSYTTSLYSEWSFSTALFIARSILSLGMFSALALEMRALRRGLLSGSVPPLLAAMVISLPSLVKTRAMLPHLLNLRSFLNSNALPMIIQNLSLQCIYLHPSLRDFEDTLA